MQKILVTGTAGFIGFHLTNRLTKEGFEVVGLDIINDYYDINLKYSRLNFLGIDKDQIRLNHKVSSSIYSNLKFIQADLADHEYIVEMMLSESFDYVVNLAAQAGVRYSIDDPDTYLKRNIVGTFNVIKIANKIKVKHLIIGSSSSVYGANKKIPFQEIDKTDLQISFYAATKKSTESLAHSYSSLWKLPITMLRFFTVYGPFGRPDMAYYKFAKKILEGKKIDIYNKGKCIETIHTSMIS